VKRGEERRGGKNLAHPSGEERKTFKFRRFSQALRTGLNYVRELYQEKEMQLEGVSDES
jgi:hypothetical protein